MIEIWVELARFKTTNQTLAIKEINVIKKYVFFYFEIF